MHRNFLPLTFALVLGMSGVTAAQDTSEPGGDDLAAVLNLLTDPVVTAEEIGQQLTACLRPLFNDALPYDEVVISVAFDGDGVPSEPELILPPQNQTERRHLRQFFRGEAAVFDCAPLTTGGAIVTNTELTLRVTDEAISIWDDGSASLPDDAATEASEAAMELSRAQRREIQQRLNLAGQSAGGADGVFGPRSRDAVRSWQDSNGLPQTGYLNQPQFDALKSQTEEAYQELLSSRPARTQRSTPRLYRGSDGCLRYRANNQIVPNQSFRCDAKGLIQSF